MDILRYHILPWRRQIILYDIYIYYKNKVKYSSTNDILYNDIYVIQSNLKLFNSYIKFHLFFDEKNKNNEYNSKIIRYISENKLWINISDINLKEYEYLRKKKYLYDFPMKRVGY
jgi:hypothetical protein